MLAVSIDLECVNSLPALQAKSFVNPSGALFDLRVGLWPFCFQSAVLLRFRFSAKMLPDMTLVCLSAPSGVKTYSVPSILVLVTILQSVKKSNPQSL